MKNTAEVCPAAGGAKPPESATMDYRSVKGKIAKGLDTTVYFTDPYLSWLKGAIENANGLTRQYIPKILTDKTSKGERYR